MKKPGIVIALVTALCLLACSDLDRSNPLDPKNPDSKRTKTVLIESFVNESGGPFIESSIEAMERLLQEYGNESLIYLEHHVEKTNGTDPWALEASLSRYLALVPIQSEQYIPDVWFNGSSGGRIQGASDTETVYQRYKPVLESELALNTTFTIEAEAALDNNQITVAGDIAKLGNDDVSDIVVVLVVCESITGIRQIVRKWVPAKAIGNLDAGEVTSFERDIALDPEWNENNLEIVVIVQHSQNFQVYQCSSLSL